MASSSLTNKRIFKADPDSDIEETQSKQKKPREHQFGQISNLPLSQLIARKSCRVGQRQLSERANREYLKSEATPKNHDSNSSDVLLSPSPQVPPSPPAQKLYTDTLGKEIVTLLVSLDKDEIVVHKTLLLHHCSFFRPYFGSNNLKSPATLSFENIPTRPFAAVVEYLYTKRVPMFDKQESGRAEIGRLSRIYVLAETLTFPRLMDALVNQIGVLYFKNRYLPMSKEVKFVYENTKSTCGLRRFLARQLADFNLHPQNQNLIENTNVITTNEIGKLATEIPELGADMIKSMSGALKHGRKELMKLGENMICDYHEHGSHKYTAACVNHNEKWADRIQ